MPSFDPSATGYYERLGVDPTASGEEIRRAFRAIARETHPDRNPGDPGAAERFRRVKEAYDVLSNPERRADYDARRRSGRADRAKAGGSGGDEDAVTATHQESVGCLAYTWRVLAGLIAVGVFVVLEVAGVWDMSEPGTVALGVVAAVVVTGLLAFAAAQSFEDTTPDHAIRFGASDVRVWIDHRMVAQVPWAAVAAVRPDWQEGRIVLEVRPAARVQAYPAPPVVAVDESGDRLRIRLDLSETNVSRDAVRRFLEKTDGVPLAGPPAA
jgi:hypothetical protein